MKRTYSIEMEEVDADSGQVDATIVVKQGNKELETIELEDTNGFQISEHMQGLVNKAYQEFQEALGE